MPTTQHGSNDKSRSNQGNDMRGQSSPDSRSASGQRGHNENQAPVDCMTCHF